MCPGDWVEHLSKINEEDDERNRHPKGMGKILLVQNISINDFGKCIGYILLEVTYGKKGYKL